MHLTLHGLLDSPLGEKARPLRTKYIQQEEAEEMVSEQYCVCCSLMRLELVPSIHTMLGGHGCHTLDTPDALIPVETQASRCRLARRAREISKF